MKIPNVDGLVSLESTESHVAHSMGRFAFPPSFDTTRFSGAWVLDGPNVDEMRQDEVLTFANCKAKGWEVFKILAQPSLSEEAEELGDTKKGQKLPPRRIPCVRAVGKNKYVLMFRPKALQKAVNEVYAAQSRQLVNQEVQGLGSAVNEANDPGILTNKDLAKMSRNFNYGEEEDAGTYAPDAPVPRSPNESVELDIQHTT